MSKKDYAVTEIITNGFGELTEISVITVDMTTRNITGVYYTKVETAHGKQDENAQPLTAVLPIVRNLLHGRKLASHTGLDFEGSYLNNLFKKVYGWENVIDRVNIIDSHVLIMRFYKGTNPNLLEATKYFGVKTTSTDNALLKSYMTYGVLKKMFDIAAIRQHTYKYAFKEMIFPVIPPVKELVEVEKVVEVPVEVEKVVYVKTGFWETVKGWFKK